ncbi:glycerophosphoryl diester phosphodiesterase membrane domain-containing protein [Streptomyces sp. P6-2-1]|uniref:glycerophosphoryl diester phosphodiesterase membrane domain-containing protein n=1 Tax=unclassified Streptomyces TaxID=2593676 RepID=UPI003D364B29
MTDTPGPAVPENPSQGSPEPAPPPHDRSAPPPGGTGRGQPEAIPGQRGEGQAPGPSGWRHGGTGPGGPPPGGPGTGWGGPGGGWGAPGGGWGGPPLAPQPGVIPLRPLELGDILGGAFRMMRTYWRAVLGISLGLAVLVVGITLAVRGTMSGDTNLYSLGSLPAEFVALLGSTLAVGMLTSVASHAVLGRPLSLKAAWREARPRLWKLLGLTVLLSLVTAAAVLVCLVPGLVVNAAGGGDGLTLLGALAGVVLAVWLYIRLSFSTAALVLERQGVVDAMRRSAKLVDGAWWRTFGILLLTGLIASVAQFVIMLPFDALGLLAGFAGSGETTTGGFAFWLFSGLGMIASTMFVFPLTAGVTVLLYVDRRIRRESLDIELAAAAA